MIPIMGDSYPKNGMMEMTTAVNKVATIRQPKNIAKITLCNAVTFNITDMCEFTPPTEEQRKNLKEMLCIDVEMLEE